MQTEPPQLATRAKGVYDLSAYRVFTGLGIGGMLAAINAVAAEFSNDRRRSFNVSLMAIGYPPLHRTPSLGSSQWTYWANRWATFEVYFDGDKVARVQR